MIYVETSVVLAQLLAEDRYPPEALWAETVVSSRLTEYETWNRINARGLGGSHGEAVRLLLGRFRWLEMTPIVLARALDPWPLPLRTLDALHLASVDFLRAHGQQVKLASYDERLINAARRLSIPIFDL
jgi:predicted nucleic acid-binding protein